MLRPPAARYVLPVFLFAAALLAACSSGSSSPGNSSSSQAATAQKTPAAFPTPLPAGVITTDAEPTSTPLPPPSPTPVPPSPTPPPAPTATPQPPAPTPTPIPIVLPPPSPTPVSIVLPAPTATAIAPAPTPVTTSQTSLAAAPAPDGLISFKPAQIQQGGFAVAYLNNANATAATLSFGGKNYPMLKDNGRFWAIVGIGALANTGAAPVSISYATSAASQVATGSVAIVHRDYPTENIDLDATTSQLLAPDVVNAELDKRAAIYSGYTMQRLWSGPFLRPNTAAVGDQYGIMRSYNHGPVTSYHTGTDFVAFDGGIASAAAAGKVAFAGPLTVRGNSVIIDHGMGVFTAYHHLSRIDVQTGQTIAAGQQVGLTGHTGLVDGPHLHWEVIIRGIEVDGLLWLKGTEIGP